MSTWLDVRDKVSRILGDDPVQREISILTKGVAAAADLVAARRELKRVASPSAVAERLKAYRQKIADESDAVMAEIEASEQNDVPAAFTHARTFLSNQKSDLEAMKAELAQLTNLPLDGSKT